MVTSVMDLTTPICEQGILRIARKDRRRSLFVQLPEPITTR